VKARNFAGAIAVALLLVLPLVVPTIARIDTWKIVLGIAGLIVFVSAGVHKG
jgi:ABC-type Fe3+ transport system permease subunit